MLLWPAWFNIKGNPTTIIFVFCIGILKRNICMARLLITSTAWHAYNEPAKSGQIMWTAVKLWTAREAAQLAITGARRLNTHRCAQRSVLSASTGATAALWCLPAESCSSTCLCARPVSSTAALSGTGTCCHNCLSKSFCLFVWLEVEVKL